MNTEMRPASRTLGLVRLAVGLAQGVLLYVLIRTDEKHLWNADLYWLLEGLILAALTAPLVFLGGVGALRRNTLIGWTAAAGLIAFGLGIYDNLRQVEPHRLFSGPPILMAATGALIFIAHHLVAAGDADRRLVARYHTYFDLAWKHGVQLVLAGGFVAVFWGVMFLGAGLFKIIGISALLDLITKPWFVLPATTTMFAAAIQLTDVRVALIRGVRTVALTLLSWLAPLMALLTAAFLIALPFEGLALLWKTKTAAALLLSAAAALIVLINAAYQEGKAESLPPALLRWGVRLGGVIIAPLVGLAAYAVALRVGQYGLTPDRVIASACVLVGAFYALGYFIAAVRPGSWMKTLEPTNVITAWVAVAVLLALFTPLADPARLAAADQLKRIEKKALALDKIDFSFLRFDAGRYGVDVLKRLKAKGGALGLKADEALKKTDKYQLPTPSAEANAMHVTAWPVGSALAKGFLDQDWTRVPGSNECQGEGKTCTALQMDMNGDGKPEVLLSHGSGMTLFRLDEKGVWAYVGDFDNSYCGDMAGKLKAGQAEVVAPEWKDLKVGEQRYVMRASSGCVQPPAPPVKDGAVATPGLEDARR